MKHYLPITLLLLIVFSKANAQAPEWLWAKSMGGADYDEGNAIAVDEFGNIYTTGFFSGVVDFDPNEDEFNLTSNGFYDIFISKLDGFGNFVWAKNLGGEGPDKGFAITLDYTGNGYVYTTGFFTGTADFDPGPENFSLTSNGNEDIFISKLDADGSFVWAKAIGGASEDVANSITLDPMTGDVYSTGSFGGLFAETVDFDPGAEMFNLTAVGFEDIFISKLDSWGNFVWAKAMGGEQHDRGLSIAFDPLGSGAVYTTGYFQIEGDFDPDPIETYSLTFGNASSIFISKLSSTGDFVWAKGFGGTGNAYGLSIAIDLTGIGDVHTTGWFTGTTDFDPGIESFNLSSSSVFDLDIFISKLDEAGNFLWAKALQGTDYEYGLSITLDMSGNVYTAGAFQGTVDFNPSEEAYNLASSSSYDSFISKLDQYGNFLWAKAFGGGDDDYARSLSVSAEGIAHLVGMYESMNIMFDNTSLTNTGGGISQIFIAKLDYIADVENLKVDQGISLFPNPATFQFQIQSLSQNISSIIIHDVLGKEIFRTNCNSSNCVVNTSRWNHGVYFVKVIMDEGEVMKKVVVE